MLVDTAIKITDATPHWGLVVVWDDNGLVSREVKITAEETLAVNTGQKEHPDCCTTEEWRSGRVMLAGRPCNPGEAFVNQDGSMTLNKGIVETKDRVTVTLETIPADKYSIVDTLVKVDSKLDVAVDVGVVDGRI